MNANRESVAKATEEVSSIPVTGTTTKGLHKFTPQALPKPSRETNPNEVTVDRQNVDKILPFTFPSSDPVATNADDLNFFDIMYSPT